MKYSDFFDLSQTKKDYEKVNSIIDSCTNIMHVNSVCNMVHNFGRMYKHNSYWMRLDRKSSKLFMAHIDAIEYLERRKHHENAINPEG